MRQALMEAKLNPKPWLNRYPTGVPHDIDTSAYRNLNDVLENACRKFGPLTAFSNRGTSLTYQDLEKQIAAMAAFFQKELNLKKGDRIALQMPNLLQYPVALFGALRAGLIVVNTNPLYTATEMAHQFKDSGCKAIVILANFASHLQEILKDTEIESVVVTEVGDLFPTPKKWLVNTVVKHVKKMIPEFKLPQAYTFVKALEIGGGQRFDPVEVRREDTAFLQYTGGTTGISKGAILTHDNVLANLLQIANWMTPLLNEGKEVCITALPLYHIFSLTVNCLAFMTYGCHNVLITNPRDFKDFIKIMKAQPFTIMTGVNTLYNALMNQAEFKEVDFSKLKCSVGGAMALQKTVIERWKSLTGSSLIEGYGLTEASPVVCCNPIDGTDKAGTIGLPVPSTMVKMVDDDGNEVAHGEVGELCVSGPQVMKGYWNRPEETAKVLRDGWLKTGDIALLDPEGFVKIVDRKKDMILVSGFNVYPNEVEDAIASHPGVLEVAVVGQPDEHSGEIVRAVVVKRPGHESLTDKEIIEHSKKSLTNYKVPRAVEFRTELPKTNVGKILRRALR